MFKKFNLRIFLPLLLAIFAVSVTYFGYLSSKTLLTKQLKDQKLYQTRNSINVIQGIIEQLILLGKNDEISKIVSSYSSQPEVVSIIVTDPTGQIIASSKINEVGSTWKDHEYVLDLTTLDLTIRRRSTEINLINNNKFIDAYSSICYVQDSNSLRPNNCGALYARIDLDYHERQLSRLLQDQALINAIGIFLASVLLWFIIYFLVTKRAMHLVSVLKDYVGGNRKKRSDLDGGDELAELGREMDVVLTQLEQDEINLKKAESFHRAILNSAEHSIIATDPAGIITSFNKGAENLLGYSSSELVGIHTPSIFHDKVEVIDRSIELTAELGYTIEPGFEVFVVKSRKGGADEGEWSYIHKNGTRIPVSLCVTAIFDEHDKIIGFLGIASDIRLRKLAENALRESEQRVTAILDTVIDSIITIDEYGIIKSCNPATEEIFQYSPGALIGEAITLLLPTVLTEERNGKIEYTKLNCLGIIGKLHETQGIRNNGNIFPAEISISKVDMNSMPIYTCVIRDISERKSFENELIEQRYRAEEGSRSKSLFLATMSHEIRTPMNGMLGMAQLLMQTELNDKQREYVNTLVSSGDTLLKQINDILDFSRIEANKLDLEISPFDLQKCCFDLFMLMKVKADEKNIQLVLDYPDDCPRNVLGDSLRIRQILLNLINNAIKFTDDGQVRLSVICIARDNMVNRFRIEVEDTGIGIEEDKIPLLFNAFTQADAGTTRQYGGSGLGLAICQNLAKLLNSEIMVVSEPGKGSRFWMDLELPISDAIAIEIDEPKPGEFLRLQGHILLVEDNLVNQKVAKAMLESLGLSVTVVDNGELAFNTFINEKYDLLLMDCQMPVMDGYEASKKIREIDNETPILAITANVLPEDIEKCFSCGMNSCLHKPVELNNLYVELAKWLKSDSDHIEFNNQSNNRNNDISTVIDLDKLKNLEDIIGDAFYELIPVYLNDSQSFVDQMETSANNNDLTTLERVAHSLKSSSRNLGANQLADLAQQVEFSARNGDMTPIQDMIDEIHTIFPAVVNVLVNYGKKRMVS